MLLVRLPDGRNVAVVLVLVIPPGIIVVPCFNVNVDVVMVAGSIASLNVTTSGWEFGPTASILTPVAPFAGSAKVTVGNPVS